MADSRPFRVESRTRDSFVKTDGVSSDDDRDQRKSTSSHLRCRWIADAR